MVHKWNKIHNVRVGNNISEIWEKKPFTIELFRDSMWGQTNNMNVIVRDSRKPSHMSSLGKDVKVEYCDTATDAKKVAEKLKRKY